MSTYPLVPRACKRKGCDRKWRAIARSTWNFCSRACAIEAGALKRDQDFRDYIALTFMDAPPEQYGKKRGYE